jgi:putative ABC transport system substrate-binding protein
VVYPLRYFATSGGLISYGPERLEPYLRAPSYVDRLFKGEKPADLPVQAPTKPGSSSLARGAGRGFL